MIEQLQNAAWNRIHTLNKKRKTAQTGASVRSDKPAVARDRDRADPGAENRVADIRAARHVDYEV